MSLKVLSLPTAGSRRLAACLVASLALHAAVVFIAPDLKWDSVMFEPAALEVRILKPTAPAPAAVEHPEPQLQARTEPRREPEQITPKPTNRELAPAAAASQPDPVVAGSFQVAPPILPGPPPEAPSQPVSVPVTPPIYDAAYLSNPAPVYPPAARRAGQQGTVTLRVLVGRDGLPLKVEVDKSSGSSLLDDAARDTVWGWRFKPAYQGGDPIESWVRVPVVFRLEGPG